MKPLAWVEQALEGWPDQLLSVLLILLALAGAGIALFGPRWLKLGLLAWWLLP